jgi:hypothetical protein
MRIKRNQIENYIKWISEDTGLKLGYHHWCGTFYQLFTMDEQGRESSAFGRVSDGAKANGPQEGE